MKHFIVSFVCVVLLSQPAFASRSCYSKLEAEAEQGVRIHSELMVIGLNCQHMGARQGMNLYGQYRAFTNKHSDLFSTYESVLMTYFKKEGKRSPVAALNTMRTDFANKISKDAATMRPDVFCSRYVPRISKASSMNKNMVRKWAATIYPSHPVSRPICQ